MAKTPPKSKPRLGRGLSSLISVSDLAAPEQAGNDPATDLSPAGPQVETATVPSGQPLEIPVEAVHPNPHQPRREMDPTALSELAASIKSTGMIQPIIVRRKEDGYQLIAGERRWRAAKLAGLTTLPALVRDVDELNQAQMALIENIQREDLNPIDRALAYRALMKMLGLTQSDLAARLGEDRSTIANFVRLLELAEPVRQLLREGKMSVGHAKLLAGVDDLLEQERLARLVVSQELSVRNLERLLKQGASGQSRSEPAEPSAHIRDLEQSITRQLGMRCQVRATSKKGRGRLVIHYSTLDQFDELLNRLNVRTD